MDESTLSLGARPSSVEDLEVVKGYRIHVSSKYLELTRKKLELTRLPHELVTGELNGGGGGDFEVVEGIRKSEIEPLIDYWLEHYSWKTQEALLNTIPQFRTAITLTTMPSPIRVHFIHIPSSDPTAIPLLLIPPFPFTNLSLGPLIDAFGKSQLRDNLDEIPNGIDELRSQSFHLIIPSLPGLGFSDSLTTTSIASQPLKHTAQLFNTLMLRLGYESYIASTTSSSLLPSSQSTAREDTDISSQIPTYISLLLSRNHPQNCLAIHLFDPALRPPRFRKEPWAWLKWRVAWFFGGGVFGYGRHDFVTGEKKSDGDDYDSSIVREESISTSNRAGFRSGTGIGLGQTHTTILSYALCDSPIGMLAYTLSTIRSQSSSSSSWNPSPSQASFEPDEEQSEIVNETNMVAAAKKPTHTFSPKDLINLTNLSWLPGPEASLRFVDAATLEIQNFIDSKSNRIEGNGTRQKSLLAITNFSSSTSTPSLAAWAHHTFFPFLPKFSLLSSATRIGGRGLICFERPEEVVEAVRGFGLAVKEVEGMFAGGGALEEVNEEVGETWDVEDGVIVSERSVILENGDA